MSTQVPDIKPSFTLLKDHPNYRDNTFVRDLEAVIYLNEGGAGDQMARLPALRYVHENTMHSKIHLVVPDYFKPLAQVILPKMNIISFSDKDQINGALPHLQLAAHQYSTMRTHPTDHGFNMLIDKTVDMKDKNYIQLDGSAVNLSRFNLPEKYVVVTPGYTVANREMLPEVINGVCDYIISKGYKPVFLGSTFVETGFKQKIEGQFKVAIDYTKALVLINQTTLLDAHTIIQRSKCVVGVDNGLIHLAGMTQVPIVAGYTTVDPKYRMPIRNDEVGWNVYPVVPDQSLKCRFCQSEWVYFNKWNFKNCYYEDNLCVKQLTADKFIKELEKIL